MIRHQDELLVRVLNGNCHQGVKQLSVARMGAHVTNIEKV